MYLTLEVVSPQAASLGAGRRRIVGPKGLTIGRVPGNDWVIPDPYISKRHARIYYSNGAFFVESLGRNAVAIGNANNPLPGNQPQPLRGGDHLFIDQYEIIVTSMPGDPPGTSVPSDDPFAVLPVDPAQASDAGRAARNAQSSMIPDVWDGGAAEGLADTGVLDPIAALGGANRAAQPEALPPVNWQQASPLEDHFKPPPVRTPVGATPVDVLRAQPAATPGPAASGIPDNWDRTSHIERSPAVKPPPRPVAPPPAARPPIREAPIPRPVVEAEPAASRPRPLISPSRVEPPPRVPSRGPVVPEQNMNVNSAASGWGPDFGELLRGVGLPQRDLTPEMMNDLGKVLRVVVQGVMDVLRARTEIKSHFRLPLTRIQSDENNPLKHSPNVESALHTLLVQRNPGFLPTVQAFEDAFADIRSHQMAMLEGLRVAFDAMLTSFDPEELRKTFEGTGKSSLFGGRGGKSKYWDLYVAYFAHLGRDADDTYRRLFGDVFAEAYEKQLERLKTVARNAGKT